MGDAKILCVNNGPYRITGSFEIRDAQGGVFDLAGREAISLCRCGHSSNKPFCDGTHNRTGFQSEVQARKLAPPSPKPTT